jgi:hypothetical protein
VKKPKKKKKKGSKLKTLVLISRFRAKIIDEIITTERDYATDLGVMLKFYIVPLRKDKILSEDDLKFLFSNVSEILDVNYSVLNQFEQRKRRKEGGKKYVIADVFAKMAEDFKIYTTYCINHPMALSTLERVRVTNSNFAVFEKVRHVFF